MMCFLSYNVFCVICNVSGIIEFVYGKLGVKNSVYMKYNLILYSHSFVTIFGWFPFDPSLSFLPCRLYKNKKSILQFGYGEKRGGENSIHIQMMFAISLMKSIQELMSLSWLFSITT